MLIFIIIVVDLAVTKFPPTKINAYNDMVMGGRDDGHGHKHHGSAANTSQC